MCTINGDTFYSFTKNTWIGDSGASCHITHDDTSMNDITNMDKLIQSSFSIMLTIKKGKLHINVQQVIGAEWLHTLWPMKFCPKACANLFSLMCNLSQGNKISSDHQNNIMVSNMCGDIIVDCQTKTHNG